MAEIIIRRLQEQDSVEELTELLHRAYARLAEMGLRFVATRQDAETTRRRIEQGQCFVAVRDGAIVGTICVYDRERESECEYYNRAGVAVFGQFAVDPDVQGGGIGRALLSRAEQAAREAGCTELALDTSEQATHLIALYSRWGFEVVGSVDWDVTNYRSVVMSKSLVRLQ